MKKLFVFLMLFVPLTIFQSNNLKAVPILENQTRDVQELIANWEIKLYGEVFVEAILVWPVLTDDMRTALQDHRANLRRGYDKNQFQLVKNSMKSLIHDMELIEEKTGWGTSSWATPPLYNLISRLE